MHLFLALYYKRFKNSIRKQQLKLKVSSISWIWYYLPITLALRWLNKKDASEVEADLWWVQSGLSLSWVYNEIHSQTSQNQREEKNKHNPKRKLQCG